MKSIISVFVLFLVGFSQLTGQTATPPSNGDGSESSPYQIATLDNLYWLSQNATEWDKYFIQTADIEASATSTWNGGEGWSPVGDGGTNFSGSYDGQGHLISNLYINRSAYYQGLFGLINNAEVKNLGLENADISGDRRTGAITGSCYYSTIENCYSTGNVSSSSDMVGGIVGENLVDGKITNCYSRCSVSALGNVGGISGVNGNICVLTNCYSTGIITGNYNTGGISGSGHSALNCFWDTITSGIGTSDFGTGISTAEMTNIATFTDTTTNGLNEAWDFPGYQNDDNGTASIWEIDALRNNGYPTLSWQYASTATIIAHSIDSINPTEAYITCEITNTGGADVISTGLCWNTTGMPDIADNTSDEGAVSDVFNTSMTGLSAGGTYYVRPFVTNSEGTTYGNEIFFKTTPAAGSGTEADPYEISSLEELAWLMGNQNVWDKHFIQTASIDASACQDWFAYKGFYPIGTNVKYFNGRYNGKGNAINNLFINRPNAQYVALFGWSYMASFDSIALTNINITSAASGNYISSVLAYGIKVSISNCSSSGNISGSSGGGIAGYIDNSVVDSCYANCLLNCSQAGGLISNAEGYSIIKNCNSEGSVIGSTYTGGLIGFFRADSVINCYSTATVKGENNYIGGLIGYADNELYVGDCYSVNNVQGADYVGGLLGYLGKDALIEACYSEGTISGSSYVGGLIGACATTDTIINCYSHADALASSSNAGGLIGQKGSNTTVYNCYSTGNVSALSSMGGLIGVSYAGTIENCFWNTETSGLTNSSGGTGKTTAELKDTTTFTNETTNGLTTAWDFFKNPGDDNQFGDIWHIDPAYNNGYPFFVKNIIPSVQTIKAINLAVDSLTSGGIVTYEGSTPVTERGICWSTIAPPMLTDSKIKSGMGLGTFTENLTQLDTSTTYYIRAYAINGYDTVYGLTDTVTTLKASQTINFDTLANAVYGDTAFVLTATSNAGLPITYSTSNPAVARISNDTVYIAGVGVTNITAAQPGNDFYSAATDIIQPFTVVKDTIWVTAHNKTKRYGETLPELSYSYSKFAYNEDSTVIDVQPTVSTLVTPSTNVGTEEITISGAEDDNYYIHHVNGIFTINKDTVTVTAHDKWREYGSVNPEFTMDYTGFENSEDVSVIDVEPALTTTADTLSDVGSYAITFSGGNDNNYDFKFIDATLTISKAALFANAGNYYKYYGEANPEVDITYTGFKNNEDTLVIDELPGFSTTANESSGLGSYPITLSGGTDNNYYFSLLDGTLTVEKATLYVQAMDTSRNYGQGNPEFRIAYTGFVNGENQSVLSELPSAVTEANINSDAGVYNITLTGGSGDNYFFSLQNGYLTILKLDQEITFNLPDSVSTDVEYIDLNAVASSGLQLGYESSDAAVAYIDGLRLYIVSAGTCTISAIQEGNANYNREVVDVPFKVNGKTNAIKNNQLRNLTVYPNPVNDIIYIQNWKDIERVEVYDLLGNKVKQFEQVTNYVNVSELKSGTYVLKLYGNNKSTVLKIIKN